MTTAEEILRTFSQSRQARALVEAAGMAYIDDTYIADCVREYGINR